MPAGRPRLTPDEIEARIAGYCERYGEAPNAETGLPPFPAGKRETPQHREWLSLYKAHARLGRRHRGQCERCTAPATDGSIFCEEHRAGSPGGSRDDRRALLESQGGLCPICTLEVDVLDAVDHGRADGSDRAVLHARCGRLARLAGRLGPEGLDRLRGFLWPDSRKPRRPRPA